MLAERVATLRRDTLVSPAAAAGLALTLDGVSLAFGTVRALDEVSLGVRSGEIVFVLGPSGSGKSSLLRVVSGIERPQRGRVAIAGDDVVGDGVFVEPENRRVGMVFQDYALFPHLTVADNVAFGLRRAAPRDRDRLVGEMLERFGVARYARGYPHMLSGGERQRVALARALAPQPRVLLMDEPFSSLDEQLRDRVRMETLAILRDARMTALVVTHDPQEALRAADRIAVLRGGRLLQHGTADELYERPASAFVARFLGSVNTIPATCRHGCAVTAIGSFPAPGWPEAAALRVCIRPQHLRLTERPSSIRAHVTSVEFLGETDRVLVTVNDLSSPIELRTLGRAPVVPGESAWLDLDAEDVVVVSDAEP